MSDFTKLRYGHANKVATATTINGSFLVTVDTQELYADVNSTRVQIGNVVTDKTEAQIKALAAANILPKLYLASDTGLLFFHNGTAWVCMSAKDASGNVITSTYETASHATSEYARLDEKIDALHSFEVIVVQTLPATGETNKLYLVPSTVTGQSDIYDEYIWLADAQVVPAGGRFEHIGTTETRLADFYNKTTLDTALGTISTYDAATSGTYISRIAAEETVSSTVVGATGYDTTKGTLSARMDTAEGAITTNANDIDALETRMTAEETVSTDIVGSTGYDTSEGTLAARASALETDVASINRFNKVTVTTLPAVADGDLYTIYFVAGQGDNKFAEYMLVDAFTYEDPTTHESITIPKHYEKINSDSDLANYYTKTEVNTALGDIGSYDAATSGTYISRISTAENDIDSLEGRATSLESRATAEETVSANVVGATGYDTAKGTLSARMDAAESAATALAGRVTAEETVSTTIVGSTGYDTSAGTLAARMTAEETVSSTVVGATSYDTSKGTLAARATALETVATDIVGSTGYDTSDGTLATRMSTLESVVDTLNSFEIEFVDELPVTGETHKIYFVPVSQEHEQTGILYSEWMWVVPDSEHPETAYFEEIGIAEADLGNYYTKDEIDAVVGDLDDYDTSKGTVSDRLDALDVHTHLYAGSQTAGGPADNVVETNQSTDNNLHDLIVAGANHDSVDYTTHVTVNTSTGQIAPGSVKLGAAVMEYDSNTQSIVVNF